MKCVSQIIMMIIISPEFLPPAPEDYDLAARGGSVVIPLERSLQSLNYPSGFISKVYPGIY
jgi:hypothetical protein